MSGGSQCNGALERRSMVLVAETHGQQVLSVLQGFRERGVLFDFRVLVRGECIPCHRCVLAACSDFFRAMFEVNMRERDDGSVTLSHLSPRAVRAFLDFAYTGQMEITEENVDMVFQLSSFLQVSVLSKACSDFLIRTLELHNCLQLLAIAEGYGSACLQRRALEFVTRDFYSLTKIPDFLDMSASVLETCLSADELQVPDEEAALRALLLWVGHDPEARCRLLPRLLRRVRLHQLPADVLEELIGSEALLSGDGDCACIVSSTLSGLREFAGFYPDARPATAESYIYVHKTEENGDIQHTFCYSIQADRWRELPQTHVADMPGSSLSSYGEKLFVTGGCRGNCCRAVRLHIAEPFHNATDEVWCYCPLQDSLAPVPPMQKPRTMHTSVTALDRVYVIGGKTRGARNIRSLLDVEYYDPLGRAWCGVSPLPRGIYYPEASACGSVIYVLGSEVEIADVFNPSLDCFFRYDAVADQWSQLVAEFGQFFHATLVKAVSVCDVLYLCDLSTYKVYSFCPETCVWKGEGSFECAGFNAGAIGVADKIYILGGDYSPDEITDEVQVYHSGRSEWEEVSPMPRALTEFHCQVIRFNRYRDPWKVEQ
ncbi:kelch repeat and BTB domain-containing protein 3 isoform X1 [Brienomyrus brachyistius]|uniref:kelch repeat and BTB domain-containing protein 3 isoform X1 n=2 Tax=Brienomyrus brachyistius TaxID=42636 RepID=UPI0020B232C8|nr:kelch repeat and BTB domain-containing protein 3 isoform X1 [Brienomyrus brachyistius]XP_048838427.1 kelch repeat and BTB domain-containing protein 3 isoform X1 [Brienomyrus brachyistius]XP_048838429.1 kelch repeat and BTB domain-containing protein 3 isoform X1 [Brienomyrus brachyistius]